MTIARPFADWHESIAFLTVWWPVIVSSTIAVAGCVIGGRLVMRARHRRLMAQDARLVRIHAPATVEEGSAAAFWSHLHALLRLPWRRVLDGQPHLVFEYTFTQTSTELGLWVPGVVPPGIIEAAVEAAWPGARTTVLRPPPTPVPSSVNSATGGRLRLARREVLPLRAKHAADPLRPLLGAGAALQRGEHAVVQVLARPSTGRRIQLFRRRLARLCYEAAVATPIAAPTARTMIFDLLTPGPSRLRSEGRTDPVRQGDLRAAVDKSVGPLWEVQIRYAAATNTDYGAARLRGVAASLAAAFGMFTERNWWARKHLTDPLRTMTARSFERGDLLRVAELAACAHIPLDSFAAGITRAGARAVPPPPSVLAGDGMKPLGVSDAGPARAVGLKVQDGRRHVHIVGSTGSGKSTLMGHMILADVAAGRGVVVIDPKGDLVMDLLDRLPEQTGRRLHLIDPGAPGPHPSLNLLSTGEPDLMVENLVGIFQRVFAAFWGPRTDDVLRSACLTLLATKPDPTLVDVAELLTNPVLRRRILALLPPDRLLLHGFWAGYAALTEPGRSAATAPLLNKLRAFLLRDFIRTVVAQPVSTIDLREVLDGGILLARVPKGMLGEETARLLGSFIVAATWQAAACRARSGEAARTDAALYVDEAHNFLTMPYPLEDMLAEARGYRLSMVLAHQNLAQMPPDLREGLSANTNNKVYFTCSPEDARALATHTAPNLSEHDLAHLDGFQAAVRLSVDGRPTSAFTLRTRPLPAPVPGRAARIRALSQAMTEAHRAA